MLPNFLIPIFVNNNKLIRVGSEFDGGYVILKKSIKKTRHLITYGISDNFDFEKHFQMINKCSVDSYDHSVDFNFWLKRFYLDVIKFLQLKIFKFNKIINIFKFIDFFIFYNRKGNNFYLKKISNKKNCVPFERTLDFKKKDVFLKIDIEGSEYEFINKLIKYERNLTGFVIEFHKVHSNYKTICKFIRNLKFQKLIHIHGNTFSHINKKKIPDTLELSFANINLIPKTNKINKKKYPIKYLDSPNSKRHKQIKLN